MASFAKATKWLLAGDKIKGKSWRKGCWWRKLGTDIINQDGDIVELNSVDLAATDWVRLVPRKRVDESLYEPVGTVPVVGDRVVSQYAPGDICTVTGIDGEFVSADRRSGHRSTAWARVAHFMGTDHSRCYILKRPERNVFTDPRVGDVVSRDGTQRTVLAVHERGVLALGGGGEVLGYSLSTWAALGAYGCTVKHRAEGGAK